MLIAFIGPHGVGKSTLGRLVARELQVPFHGEVGERLARDPAHRAPGAQAVDPQPAFDRRVFEEELARDLAWDPRALRVVESWHPGNLAYAMWRSPEVALEWLPAVREVVGREEAVVVSLSASARTLRQRQHETGDAAFFRRVGQSALYWAFALGLSRITEVRTDSTALWSPLQSPTHTAHIVLARLRELGVGRDRVMG